MVALGMPLICQRLLECSVQGPKTTLCCSLHACFKGTLAPFPASPMGLAPARSPEMASSVASVTPTAGCWGWNMMK